MGNGLMNTLLHNNRQFTNDTSFDVNNNCMCAVIDRFTRMFGRNIAIFY